ncbi:MAG: ATP-binding protein, partial [Okeania sp. SIO2H7]|nr:ATP-binding protein [Okeania sp. SIO2H7]
PERFVGRENEIAIAFDQILTRSNLALWGGSGIGKTSFLELLASREIWQLQGYDPSNAIIVYLNCLGIYPFVASTFWREILKLIKEQLETEVFYRSNIDTLIAKAEVTKDDVGQILKKIGEANQFLLLLLDDYDATLRPHPKYTENDIKNFLSECRNLAYHSQERRYLSVIVTSSRRLTEISPNLTPENSPWYNHYLFQPLKPFTDNEAAILLAGMPMTPSMRDGIREIAGGHPALLQNAGFLLYSKRRSGPMPDVETYVRDFLTATEQYFQGTWQLANELEQTLLMLIALSNLKGRLQKTRYDLGDISIIFSQRERELNELEQRGVIIRSFAEEKTNYSFASSLMEWWVIKEIENSTTKHCSNGKKCF